MKSRRMIDNNNVIKRFRSPPDIYYPPPITRHLLSPPLSDIYYPLLITRHLLSPHFPSRNARMQGHHTTRRRKNVWGSEAALSLFRESADAFCEDCMGLTRQYRRPACEEPTHNSLTVDNTIAVLFSEIQNINVAMAAAADVYYGCVTEIGATGDTLTIFVPVDYFDVPTPGEPSPPPLPLREPTAMHRPLRNIIPVALILLTGVIGGICTWAVMESGLPGLVKLLSPSEFANYMSR